MPEPEGERHEAPELRRRSRDSQVMARMHMCSGLGRAQVARLFRLTRRLRVSEQGKFCAPKRPLS